MHFIVKALLALVFLSFIPGISLYTDAQTQVNHLDTVKTVNAFTALGHTLTSDYHIPFWMRSMQRGALPQAGGSASVFGGIKKEYNHMRSHKLLDWGSGLEFRGNIGDDYDFYLIEAYAKVRFSIFQISAGRTKDIIGLIDSTSMSTGSFILSGNALGIPKIEFSNPNYWNIPFTDGLIAFKGNLAHGWFGSRLVTTTNTRFNTYLHQKSLHGRLGKKHWKIRLYGGFNHTAMWGNENQMFDNYGISNREAFTYVFIGKAYGNRHVPTSKVGNHLGSIDQGLDLRFKNWELFAYHQFYYEAGALVKLANIEDGTWGVSLTNKAARKENRVYWKRFLIEFIHSKSQGGELDDPDRPSGFEDYYNNYQYIEGWAYEGENLGNVLFTSQKYMRKELPQPSKPYFVNNRITALHLASVFGYNRWRFTAKFTASKNFGHYSKYPAHRGLGEDEVFHDPPYFGQAIQYSGYLEASWPMQKGLYLNMALAVDRGDLLYHSSGGFLRITKRW